jgi:replicative DNA helicase
MPRKLESEGEQLGAVIDELEREHGIRETSGWETGFAGLSGALDGIHPGLTLIVGAPGCGKTSFARQLLDQIARHNRVPAIFFTFAESRKELRIKTLARLSEIDANEIRRGSAYLLHWYGVPKPHHADPQALAPSWEKVRQVAEDAKPWLEFIYLVECHGGTDLSEIAGMVRQARAETGAQSLSIVVDDCQRLSAGGRALDERAQGAAEELQQAAADLSIPIIAVWPDLRASEGRSPAVWTERFPSADVIMVLEAEGQPAAAASQASQHVSLHLVKNRRGERGKLAFLFQPAFAKFTET